MKNLQSVTFDDGFTVRVGQDVQFTATNNSRVSGTVLEILKPTRGAVVVKVQPERFDCFSGLDRYPLRDGGEYLRCRDFGLYGGELYR